MKATMLYIVSLVFVLIFLFFLAGCRGELELRENNEKPVLLTISAATSLRNAAQEIKAAYEQDNPNVRIAYNFASSGTLQKQIEEGAPVDYFISAGKSQMEALQQKDLVVPDSLNDLLSNEIVLITGLDSNISSFADLSSSGVLRISIGTPESVPAGKYARETLVHLGLWEKISGKLVLAKDVNQVLTYVETGNVDAGLLYRTDSLAGSKIRIVAAAPPGSHSPVVYPAAVVKGSKKHGDAVKFGIFLRSEAAARIFEKHGFDVL